MEQGHLKASGTKKGKLRDLTFVPIRPIDEPNFNLLVTTSQRPGGESTEPQD